MEKGAFEALGIGELAPLLDVATSPIDMIHGLASSVSGLGSVFSGDKKGQQSFINDQVELTKNNPISNWVNEQIFGKDWASKTGNNATTASGLPTINPKIIENQIMSNTNNNNKSLPPIIMPVSGGSGTEEHSVSKSMDINDMYLMTALTGGLD